MGDQNNKLMNQETMKQVKYNIVKEVVKMKDIRRESGKSMSK